MRARESGWSYIELLATVTILVVGVIALMKGFFDGSRLTETARETTLLNAACRNVVETLRTVPFNGVVAQYGSGSGRDRFWCGPEGVVSFSAMNNAWAQGRIEFFNNESAIPSSFANLSGGFDLNANGTVEAQPVSDFKILPVRVTCDVAPPSQSRPVTLELILMEVN